MNGFRLVDLSVTIAPDLPAIWPGNPALRLDPLLSYDGPEGVFNRRLTADEHVGTHWDAPAHFLADYAQRGLFATEDVPLERLVAPAAVVDATDLRDAAQPGRSPRVTAERLAGFERTHGVLRPGDAVLLRTGWSDDHYRRPPAGRGFAEAVIAGEAPPWPALGDDACRLLVEREVGLVGFDAPSAGAFDDVAAAHRILLAANVVLVENLTGLRALPPRGATFAFLPLKLAGGSGAPGRAIGLVPD
jgi:kynurenine formamidase